MHKEGSFASPVPSAQPRFPAHPVHELDQSAWPDVAEFSICEQTYDRRFPDVKHIARTSFFNTRCDLERYIEERKDWVKGTDGDFRIIYHIYRWDWGPRHESSGSISW